MFWLYCTLVTTSTTDSKIHNTHTRHALPFSIISTLILLRMFATRNRFPRTVDTNEEEVWWNCRITCCSMRARAYPYRPIWRTCHVRSSFSNCDVIILAFFVQVKKRLNPNLNGIFGQLARNYGLDAFEQFVFFCMDTINGVLLCHWQTYNKARQNFFPFLVEPPPYLMAFPYRSPLLWIYRSKCGKRENSIFRRFSFQMLINLGIMMILSFP